MQFPSAYKGVKKVFLAELLVVIVSLVGIALAVLANLPNPNEPLVITLGAIAGVSGIILIVAFIFQLIGLGQAGKDSGYMRFAFWIIILAILLTIAVTILKSFFPQYESVYSILDTVSKCASAVVLVLVVFGITVLASELRDEKMVNRGRFLLNLIVILFIIVIALNIAATFIQNPQDWWTTFVLVFSIIAAVLELLIYVLYFLYLAKAVKMLKK